MSKFKVTVEKDGEEKEFECDEYWLFVQANDGEDSHFQHQYEASKLFRGHVQSHVTLINLSEHLDSLKNHQENGKQVNSED